MRVLILGDSLPAQRPATGQPIECTWPVLLKQRVPDADIWYRARYRSTCREVVQELNLFSDSIHFFDSIVIQVGVVDACPRPYPHALQRFIWGFFSERVTKFVNKNAYRLLKLLPGKPWISEERFRADLRLIVDKCTAANPGIKILFIKIAPARGQLVANMPGVEGLLAKYNGILEEVVRASAARNVSLLDPFDKLAVDELIIDDGHHLTVSGHRVVAEEIEGFLRPQAQ